MINLTNMISAVGKSKTAGVSIKKSIRSRVSGLITLISKWLSRWLRFTKYKTNKENQHYKKHNPNGWSCDNSNDYSKQHQRTNNISCRSFIYLTAFLIISFCFLLFWLHKPSVKIIKSFISKLFFITAKQSQLFPLSLPIMTSSGTALIIKKNPLFNF